MFWDGFWGYFGTKNITYKSWHDNRIRFTTTRMKIGGHRQTGQRSSAQKPVNILLFWILFRATPVKNVWPPRSQSGCSQVSAALFYAWTAKFVGVQICVGDMRVSRLQAKGWQHHPSQNIGPVIAGSARPAPPALSERNECPTETVPLKLFKNQSSNFKSLRKRWDGPGHPSRPTSDCHGLGEPWI